MEWKEWIGKKIFVQLRSGGVYTGKIIEVDNLSNTVDVFFITIIDKFNKKVVFVTSEIIKISEEGE